MKVIDIFYYSLVAILIILYYLNVFTKMKAKVIKRMFVCVFLLGGIVYATFWYVQRDNIKDELGKILLIAEKYSDMDQRLSEAKRYDDILLEIDHNEEVLNELLKKSNLIEKILGRSEDVDSLAHQTKVMLTDQKYRILRLNYKSSHTYNPLNFEEASSELQMLNPDALDRQYMYSGFKLNHSSLFIKDNDLLVRIVEMDTDSVLYQQTYVPKDTLNSFVLPNYFSNDNIQLQMGYISRQDSTTYHYITYVPYGKK